MADASILVGGFLIRTTKFKLLGFNHKTGYLARFTYNNISYVQVNHQDFTKGDQIGEYAIAGYYEESKFLDYNAKKLSSTELSGFKMTIDDFEKGVVGDKIHVRKLKIEYPYTEFCYVNDITWIYEGGDVINDQSVINIPPIPLSKVDTEKIILDPIAETFYRLNIGLVRSSDFPAAKKDEGAYVITKIALHINNIQKYIFPIFKKNTYLSEYISSQNLEWNFNPLFVNPSLEEMQSYLDSITTFYNVVYANQIIISKTRTETSLYWLTYLLSKKALEIIPPYDKIKVLNLITKGTVLGAISSLYGGIDEEKFAIKIVKSIIPGQEDDFFAGLKNVDVSDTSKKTTLFEALYNKVNDKGAGDENLKELLNELYKLWIRSSLYPYNIDGTIKTNLINPTHYESKPIVLNYEADSVLGAFNRTNYNFSFNNYKIDVKETIDNTIEHQTISKDVLIGSYDLFQAVSIKNTDSNTDHIKFIAISINGSKQALLPIFYLKYIDDKKTTENLITEVQIAIDILFIISGVGTLEGLHLRNITKIGRIALGLEAATGADIIIFYEVSEGVIGAIDISASVVSMFISYGSNYSNTYCNVNSSSYDKKKCDFYTELDTFFNVLQVFTGVLDFATSRLLKKSTQKLLNDAPDNLDSEVKSLLQKFTGDIDEFKVIFKNRLTELYGEESVIWRKFNALKEIKQEEFLIDFGSAEKKILDTLQENEGKYIDYWNEIRVANNRKNIEYLKAYKFISEDDVLKHAMQGDINISRAKKADGTLENTNVVVTGMHNPHELITPPPYIEGKWNFKNDIFENDLGYRKGKIERCMTNEDIDTQTGKRWFNSFEKKLDETRQYMKGKKDSTVFWPKAFDEQRIKEEMALAFMNKVHIKSEGILASKYGGTASDGMKIIINYDQYGKWSIYPNQTSFNFKKL